ncbi:hypothetical protein FNH22_05255 [Fulvivirga sp. M361]|uniref:hypothetical protein n=1 Tax=Fulvivirga sp. M361 TaxID=2594266 RepID=UPI00117A3FB9|nr:hypothetical protein [Fulvivirga sp. M361]TRX61463.1 hypothetical protein FNH22_05255 [Fulvivirga sp. M361]
MFNQKKSLEVYSAAKATIMEIGKSKEEVWDYFALAFKETPDKYLNLSYNGYPFEIVKGVKDIIEVGNVYKNYDNRDSVNYFEITDWGPYTYFSYNENHESTNAEAISKQEPGGNRMEFFFKDHYEGTIVEIHRRQQGTVTKREMKEVADGARVLLSSILNNYYNKLGQHPHSMHIELNDSLKTTNGMK